jgi:hypothetical protein
MREEDADCPECRGTMPCYGGGNVRCWRRHREPQIIAAILDSYGGVRTIVCTMDVLLHHVGEGELARVVPNLTVHEPIAWNDIPSVIERARIELEKWIDTRPNLDAQMHHAVTLYRLRCLEQRANKGSLDFNAIAL